MGSTTYEDLTREELLAEATRLRSVTEAQRHELVRAERDAADRRAALEHEKRFLDTVIRNVPAGMAYLDRDEVFQWVNPAMCEIYGLPPERFIGRRLGDLFPAAPRPNPRIRAVLETGERVTATGFPGAPIAGGAPREPGYWDFAYVPVREPDGTIGGMLSVCLDATERVRRTAELEAMNARLLAADRHKDEFLGVISHELRTPLNFITGFGSLLEDEVPGPLNPRQRDYVGHILGGADRMLRLVDDLLDVARLQAGKIDIVRTACAYPALVAETVRSLAPLAAERGIDVALAVEAPDAVALDADRIGQVLLNLVGNALKFTPAGGRVAVRGFVRGDALVTEVADTGPGIPEAELPRIFERFHQLDMSTTRSRGGTGLGLAIAKALVEAHGGEIDAESLVGVGSTFRFRLPASAAHDRTEVA
jgi:PAS domain S-box-containing protein